MKTIKGLEMNINSFPNDIWQQMTKDEQEELLCMKLCGMHLGPDENGEIIIAHGSWMWDKISKFQQRMINKYGKKDKTNTSKT